MYTTPSHLYNSPIYTKALEIFSLTRKISHYLNYDLSKLKTDGTEDENVYFSGDIVQQSELLGPEINNRSEFCNFVDRIKRSSHYQDTKLNASALLVTI